jgi:hypothetical protein
MSQEIEGFLPLNSQWHCLTDDILLRRLVNVAQGMKKKKKKRLQTDGSSISTTNFLSSSDTSLRVRKKRTSGARAFAQIEEDLATILVRNIANGVIVD